MEAVKPLVYDPDALVEYGWRRAIITITVVLCALLELIDTTIVNVATTTLMGALGATVTEITWVIASYAIANVIVVPMSGWLSARFGRKNYFAASIALFTFGSFMCANSTGIWELVGWRFIQGIGGGALLTTAQSILVEIYPKKKIGMAMAFFGMGVILGPTLGPVTGGYLIEHYEWPVIFTVNIPVGIIAFFLTLQFIKDNPFIGKPTRGMDWFGLFLLIIGIGSLQLFLEQGEQQDWFESKFIMIVAAAAVIGIIGFIYKMYNTREPIVDLSVLKKGNLAIGIILQFILGFVLFGSVFVLPLFMQRFLGFSPTATGAIFIPGALLSGLSMPLVGRVLQNGFNPKILIVIGFSLTAIFVGWIPLILTSATSESYFFWPLLIRGLGMGFIFVPISNLALAGLQGRDLTQASGLMNMIRQIGGSLSVAIIGVLTVTGTAQHRNDLLPNISTTNTAFNDTFNGLVNNFMRFTSDINVAQQQAYSIMERKVFAQASVLTYIDILQYITLFILICIPLILMARTIKAKAPSAEEGGGVH